MCGERRRKSRSDISPISKMFDNGQRAPCCVQVHLLDVRESCDVFREKGQRLSEWVSCAEAARRVREPELKGLFLSMQRALSS